MENHLLLLLFFFYHFCLCSCFLCFCHSLIFSLNSLYCRLFWDLPLPSSFVFSAPRSACQHSLSVHSPVSNDGIHVHIVHLFCPSSNCTLTIIMCALFWKVASNRSTGVFPVIGKCSRADDDKWKKDGARMTRPLCLAVNDITNSTSRYITRMWFLLPVLRRVTPLPAHPTYSNFKHI